MKELDIHPAEAMPLPQPKKQFAVLNQKDIRKLTFNGYEKAKEKFPNVYLLRNKKTGKIAELHAASPLHAAKMLGWNPKKTQVLIAREAGKEPVVPEVKLKCPDCQEEHVAGAACNKPAS
jgi:hypothetical protein